MKLKTIAFLLYVDLDKYLELRLVPIHNLKINSKGLGHIKVIEFERFYEINIKKPSFCFKHKPIYTIHKNIPCNIILSKKVKEELKSYIEKMVKKSLRKNEKINTFLRRRL